MSKEEIGKAFDDFSNDRFMDAEETLKQVINKKVNDHLKDTLKLQKDPFDLPKDDE